MTLGRQALARVSVCVYPRDDRIRRAPAHDPSSGVSVPDLRTMTLEGLNDDDFRDLLVELADAGVKLAISGIRARVPWRASRKRGYRDTVPDYEAGEANPVW